MNLRIVTAFLLVSLVAIPTSAQSFRLVETTMLPTTSGSVALGDLDNDGDLDVVLTGTDETLAPVTKMYRNNGSGTFEEVLGTGLPATRKNSIDLGDADNDGDLDILIMGPTTSDVFLNDGNLTFTRLGLDLPLVKTIGTAEVVNTKASAWGDYDNDGDLDILISGIIDPRDVTLIYRNDGSGTFRRANDISLDGLESGSVEWGDFDNDGDADILATSQPAQGVSFTKIWRNNGNNTFSDINASLPGIKTTGSAKWGDYNNDGFLDVLIAGTDPDKGDIDGVYRNLGNDLDNRFDRVQAQLPVSTFADWIDFDNDGRRDVLLNRFDENGAAAGKSASASAAALELYRNVDTQSRFEKDPTDLDGIWFGAIATGDLDNDHAPDILATGGLLNANGSVNQIGLFYYRNAARAVPNQRPEPPPVANLQGEFNGNDLVLEWTDATDPDSPATSLTYNVRVGTSFGASDVLSAMSLNDGTRLVPRAGNAGHGRRLVIRNIDPTKRYYWAVQAVDASYTGSEWAVAPSPVNTHDDSFEVPSTISLLGNYPNPFNPGTTIQYALPERSPVHLTIYNMLGAKIVTLVDATQPAGQHDVYWNGRDALGHAVPSGLYLYRLEAQGHTLSKTMVLLK
ncbi:MAG: FG-GAP-like repeat-containing protein [Rhodothermales bacterium]